MSIEAGAASDEAPVEEEPPSPTESGFEDVYARSYVRMVRLARLTGADAAPAEEIVQDAFLQLYRRWSHVQHPLSYLRLAVVNGVRSWGRRRGTVRRHRLPPAPETSIDGDALAVRQALSVLTARQRTAVVLRYFEDLPESEIAAILRCRPGTVKSLLARSMPKLKGALSDD